MKCTQPRCRRHAVALCDHELAPGEACGAQVCELHRTKAGAQRRDLCPRHAREWNRARGDGPSCGGCGGEAHQVRDGARTWIECTHGCGWTTEPPPAARVGA